MEADPLAVEQTRRMKMPFREDVTLIAHQLLPPAPVLSFYTGLHTVMLYLKHRHVSMANADQFSTPTHKRLTVETQAA